VAHRAWPVSQNLNFINKNSILWTYSYDHTSSPIPGIYLLYTDLIAPQASITVANLNTLASARIQGFLEKKRLNARAFARKFLWSCMLNIPGKSFKRCGKSSSLHSKKNFLLGECGFFVSDVISGGLLGHLGPLRLALGANR